MQWFAALSILLLCLAAALFVRPGSKWGAKLAWPAGVGAMSAGLLLPRNASLARFVVAVGAASHS